MVTVPGNRIQAHFGRYTTELYVVLATLSLGVLLGMLAVTTLSVADKLTLMAYVKRFVDMQAVAPTYGSVFRPALIQNLKLLGMLYLLGVSVAGMPLVLAAVFFRGFVLGFAVDFLITGLHGPGAILSMLTVGLESVFLVPALIIAAAVALGFSWELISPSNRQKVPNLGKSFAYFTGLMMTMALVTVVGTFIEAYVAPLLMHLMSGLGV